jgi:chemotaxis protein MotA
MKKISSTVGLIGGIVIMLVAFVLEGGHLISLIQITAFLIVIMGTFATMLIGFPFKTFKTIPKLFKIALFDTPSDTMVLVNRISELAEKSRREGNLSLEEDASKEKEIFVRNGLMLVVDGVKEDVLIDTMELEMIHMHKRHMKGISMIEKAGNIAPALGITGTVMGLLHILSNLSNPEELGGQISMAFVATLYGVFTGNFIWLPIASKLKEKSKAEVLRCEMIIEGLSSIQANQNPKVIRQKLLSFLPPTERI